MVFGLLSRTPESFALFFSLQVLARPTILACLKALIAGIVRPWKGQICVPAVTP